MLVMKFGGASVKNPEAVRNVVEIVRQYAGKRRLVVVVSAMDKTTNHLETLAGLARDAKEVETWERFRKIKSFHHEVVDGLFDPGEMTVREEIDGYFEQVERIIQGILLLGEFPNRTYDRIVAFGELLSTAIASHYLRKTGLAVACPDARNLIKTDTSHTHASVIWSLTRENVQEKLLPLFETNEVVVTQGFIASSIEGKVTTLGREGSDYTASILAACLEAESVTVWKDVRGILNGDPRIESETVKLDELSYERAVEMTFYGASVIHPKTIKPLRNAGIPLYVKCFQDLAEEGTVIREGGDKELNAGICSRIVKQNQVLISITPRDFSFMDERQLNTIFNRGLRAGVQVSLVQTSAISLKLCATDVRTAIDEFESLLLDEYKVSQESGLVLRTFINYGDAELLETRAALLTQQADNKLLAVMRG